MLPGRWWVRLDSQQAWGLGAWKPPGKELRSPTYRLEACAHFPGLGELSPVGAGMRRERAEDDPVWPQSETGRPPLKQGWQKWESSLKAGSKGAETLRVPFMRE